MSNTYFILANGSLTQNWSNTTLITINDDWSGVASIEGYLGQDITTATGTDPRTLTTDSGVANDLDVIANQGSNTAISNGGVAEFDGLANPTIALQGSGTADAPFLKFYLDASSRQNVRLQFNARDIDGTTDNAIQQLNVQYRIGNSGAWSNVTNGYNGDVSEGPSLASLFTFFDVTLPGAANGQGQVQVRIMTTNAVGNDEWVGIDDIVISSSPLGDAIPPTLLSTSPTDEGQNIAPGSDIVLTFNEAVALGSGNIVISNGAGDVRTITVGGAADPDGTVTVNGNSVTINPTTNLNNATTYHVTVSAGAIKDASGNDFAGIAAGGLDFTTLDPADVVGGVLILDEAQSLQGFQGATPTTAPTGTGTIHLVRLGEFTPAGVIPTGSNAEVVSFDPVSKQMFILNTNGNRIDIVKINTDGSLTEGGFIDLSGLTGFGGANSVAVKNGIVAVAYGNANPASNGFVALYDTAGSLQKTIAVGVLPDMLTFTPDGTKILVANEAEAISNVNNPAGSISIINVAEGAAAAGVANTIGFTSLNGSETVLKARGIDIFTGQSAAADIEPEYISVSPDGTRAYVTLQEVNAVAVIDLTNAAADRPMSILPLGIVDHNLAGNEFDPSDQDGGIHIGSFDVFGVLQPDAIDSFQVGGVTYFVTANEGDSRVGTGITDSIRVNSANYTLDTTEYPTAATLETNSQLGRLNVLTDLGNTDADPQYEQVYTLGGRGISIFKQNADGTIVKVRETGGEFEKIIAALQPTIFNQNNDAPGVDARSDDKGPEPEGVDIGVINGHTYAFVALERTGGVMIYDVTDPANAAFVGYKPPAANGGGPEVAKFIDASQSPTGTALVLTANEVGGTTTVYAALPANFTETLKITASPTAAAPEGNSGTTAFTFVVERSGGTLGTVNFTVELASAAANTSDFSGVAALPKTINGTLAAGVASTTIAIQVKGDTAVELNESFTVALKTATLSLTDATGASVAGASAAISATESSATATILNDDVTHHIYDIQGSGHISPLVGQVVTTQGVVSAVDVDGSRGFYIQEVTGDGNAATSDGIFVFLPSGPLPTVGHLVNVTGTVSEFTPSGAAVGSFSTTEIGSVSNVTDLGVGPAITPVQIGGVGGLLPPTQSLIAGANFYESLEGMLVKVKGAVAVGPTNSFGEIFTVVDNDANPANGTSATGQIARGNVLITPGTPDFGDINAGGGDYNPERVQIDDDSGVLAGFASPNVNVGARLGDVTGVVNYDFGNYQVVATQAYAVTQASTLVKETGTLTGDGDHLLVASYNAENLDANDPASRFTTIASEIISRLKNPDIISLQEIQDNDGAVGGTGSSVTSASLTLQKLIDAISAAGGPSYAFIDNPFIGDDTNGGEPGGNIRTAFLYRTDRVDFIESSLRTLSADGSPISNPAGNDDQHSNPDNPFFGSRPPLVATFVFNGEEVTIVNNHFTSKGGSAPLLGSDQPPFNAGEVQRAGQAQSVNNFVDSLLAANPNTKIIVAGDLNEHPWEEPMQVLKGTATVSNYDVPGTDPFNAVADYAAGGTAVLSDLQDTLPADQRYDYVFEGNSQTLDHMLVTSGLQSSAQFDVVRINAEFFDQTSDHDPLVVRFEIERPHFTLQLLHLSDGEAGLLASQTAPNLAALVDAFDDDYANTLILSGGDNFIPGPFLAAGTDLSVIPVLNAATGSTIGATINVPIAAVDIAILNSIGVETSTIGNHEFDLSSRVLRDAFSPNLGAAGWVGAQFPYLSSNLDFSGDADLASRFTNTLGAGFIPEASTLKGRIAPAAVVTEGGQKIGIVGATTQILESISSPSGTEVKGFPGGPGPNGEVDDMTLLAAQLQPIIDEMIAEGINKIIVQSHLQQIENEQLLATKLHGVDIILSAGSNTRLGDSDDTAVAFPGHSAEFEGAYPLQVLDADGKTTLIVNTDGEYTYLGRLVVEFDAGGNLILDSLTANHSINGAYAATAENVAEAWGTTVGNLETTAFADGTKGDKVRDLTTAVQNVINIKDGNVFGFTEVYLEGERGIIRNEETNLGDITADANAAVAREALGGSEFMVSLKNGGGIRAQIGTVSAPDPITGAIDKLPPPANPASGKPEGGISQLDVENSLRFDNKLMVFETTAQGLLNILNWGAGLGANNGGFPQIGGVQFSFDPTLPGNVGTTPGSRIRDVALIDDDGNVVPIVDNGVVLPGAPALIRVVTLNFTANGGDGYPVKVNADNFRYLLNDGTLSGVIDEAIDFTAPANVPANALGEQKAFEDYLEEVHGTPETAYEQADTPRSLDERIQNLGFRSDTVLANDAPVIIGDLAIAVGEGQTVVLTTADLDENDPDNGGAGLTYTVISSPHGTMRLKGVATTTFTQADLAAGLVTFQHDGSEGGNASFVVTLTDSGSLTSAPATVMIDVAPINDTPTITSNGGGSTAAVPVQENTTAVTTITATDVEAGQTLTFSIAGGPDAGLFALNGNALTFVTAPDFEGPADANGDNVYVVTVQVADGNDGIDTQEIAVTVSNVAGISPPASNAATITGTNEEDILTGLGGANLLQGLGGNDVLIGANGADTLNGGAGGDTLTGGAGNDVVNGGDGNDIFNYVFGDGKDTVDGGSGFDTLNIIGTTGANTLDVIFNGVALTNFEGGTVTGVESISANLLDAIDTLNYEGTQAGVTVNLSSGAASGFSSIAGIENVTGGAGDDSLTGGDLVNVLNGGAGRDTLDGGLGNDTLIGGTGDDTYFAGVGDIIKEAAGGGIDSVLTDSNAFTLASNVENLTFIGAGDFTSNGNGEDNILAGGSGNDTLNGGGGNDIIIGGAGNDIMNGGAGPDTFVFAAHFGNDTISGFDANPSGGQDLLDISALGIRALDFAARVRIVDLGPDTRITIDGTDTITLLGVNGSGANLITQQDFILSV